MAIQITLPKDAEGKEVPLDTKTLYDEYGNQWDVAKFIYDLSGETTDSKWTVEYKNGVRRFISQMYLTQPDSWKKLEEDLDKCISNNDSCCYYSKSGMCCDCTVDSSSIDYRCDSLVFNSIKERIRKLRSKE
jgi:hypothetical protein